LQVVVVLPPIHLVFVVSEHSETNFFHLRFAQVSKPQMDGIWRGLILIWCDRKEMAGGPV
jgi:hypothetical protein